WDDDYQLFTSRVRRNTDRTPARTNYTISHQRSADTILRLVGAANSLNDNFSSLLLIAAATNIVFADNVFIQEHR
ncbi:hypothetical protein HAX54_031107, partial [Datura stramonium]|nr:hypothetical protein [Datura stramonium]